MAQHQQDKNQSTAPNRDQKSDSSSQFSEVMDSAKSAIREGLKKAGDIIERAGIDAQNAGMKKLGEWIERAGDTIEHFGEDRSEKRNDDRSGKRNDDRTENRSQKH